MLGAGLAGKRRLAFYLQPRYFFSSKAQKTKNIKIDGGDVSKAAAVLALKNGATKKAVQLRD
jgi:hypothetical protein